MGHIQLSREADLVVVCPATADLLAKMAAGIADDLATTLLLATDKKVLAAPAMNVRMWQHEATKRNVARLRADGVTILEPDEGEMACGEYGPGRLPEPEAIFAAIEETLGRRRARSPAGTSSSPPARPTSRSIRCGCSPTAPRAGRASPIADALAGLGRAGQPDRRPRRSGDPAGRRPDRRRDRARDGRRGRKGPARRRRGHGRRGRRLAGRSRPRPRSRRAPAARPACRSSKIRTSSPNWPRHRAGRGC